MRKPLLRTILFAAAVAGGLTMLNACSRGGKSSPRGVSGKARVGQMGSSNQNLTAGASKWGDVAQSTSQYSWVKVEGLKVELAALQGTVGGDMQQLFGFSPTKTLELKNDLGAISIESDIFIPAGTYSDLGVSIKNKYSVKGFCRTSTESLYTTEAGIRKCTGGACGDSDDLPSDYDYYAYDFMLPKDHYGNTIYETNKVNFTLSEDSSPIMTLLFDPSYTISCADSTADLDHDGNRLPPFGWTPNPSSYYTGAEGNFGAGYMALFTFFTPDPSQSLPVGETYVASSNINDVDDGSEAANLINSMITTIAVDANGDILAARSRNFDTTHGTDLQQGWSGFSTDAPNSYTMMNGEHWSGNASDHSDARWLQDRMIVGFQRSSDYTQRRSFVVEDGPECGKNLGDKNRPCANSPVTTYWKLIRR